MVVASLCEFDRQCYCKSLENIQFSKQIKNVTVRHVKSYVAIVLIKMNDSVTEDNIQRQDVAGPSNQINLPCNQNYGRPSESALPMETRVNNAGYVIAENENKVRRRYRQCKNNTIYMCNQASSASLRKLL